MRAKTSRSSFEGNLSRVIFHRTLKYIRVNLAILTALATFTITQPAQADSQGASEGSVLLSTTPLLVSAILSSALYSELEEFSLYGIQASIDELGNAVSNLSTEAVNSATYSAEVSSGVLDTTILGIYDLSTQLASSSQLIEIRIQSAGATSASTSATVLRIPVPRAYLEGFEINTSDSLKTYYWISPRTKKVDAFVIAKQDRAFLRIVTTQGQRLLAPKRTISGVTKADFGPRIYSASYSKYKDKCLPSGKPKGYTLDDAALVEDLVQQGKLATTLVDYLDETNANNGTSAAVVGRSGTVRDNHPMDYTHAGIFTKSTQGNWIVSELLECGSVSKIWERGAWAFFMAKSPSYKAIVAPVEVEKFDKEIYMRDPILQAMHNPNYNLISNPHSLDYQNSNEWILDLLSFSKSESNAALSPGVLCQTERLGRAYVTEQLSSAKRQLAEDRYSGENEPLSSGEKLFASFSSRGTLDDHQNCDGSTRDVRQDGRRIVTVDSLVEYMRNWDFSDDTLIKRLTVDAFHHRSTMNLSGNQ